MDAECQSAVPSTWGFGRTLAHRQMSVSLHWVMAPTSFACREFRGKRIGLSLHRHWMGAGSHWLRALRTRWGCLNSWIFLRPVQTNDSTEPWRNSSKRVVLCAVGLVYTFPLAP